MDLTFGCSATNDLYSVLTQNGHRLPRYDTGDEAVEHASPGSGVLVLADGYPDALTKVDDVLFEKALEKNLRLFVEYPAAVPGMEVGTPQGTVWERVVVSSDAFGDGLRKMRILALHDCTFVPVSGVGSSTSKSGNPMLVVARVAGFDTAVYGLPENAAPILFEVPERSLLVATTKLSNFVTGRYAPAAAWKTIWERILTILDPDGPAVSLSWTTTVRPAYRADERLPGDVERRAFRSAAKWYHESRLLVSKMEEPEIRKLLLSGAEGRPVPSNGPNGNGEYGILEGYASAIRYDGSQVQRVPLRSDCNAESAMVMALDWAINRNQSSRVVATNLLDWIYFNSGVCKGGRGNPKHPAFGLIAWGDIARAWMIANYGDDDARAMLGTMVGAACMGSDRWDEPLLRALLANLRTTGTLGFRGDRIDMPAIESRGWKAYYDAPTVNLAPHFESYLWACYLWAYDRTHYKPFLEKTKTAIRMTMEAFPDRWRWNDSIERARILLCLAWLVRVEDTPEHRTWLDTVASDLLSRQQPCGALQERLGGAGGGHYWVPKSNEAYGTSETPLIQQNGDPASDQLYTTGFALLALHEAAAATGDPKFKNAEDKLAEFLCRIQVRSEKHPYLNGTWFRAFDYERWEYWASSADAGWGAWSVESGWAQAWTAAVLGFRLRGTSLWELTSRSKIIDRFHRVQQQMAENKGGPWTGGSE